MGRRRAAGDAGHGITDPDGPNPVVAGARESSGSDRSTPAAVPLRRVPALIVAHGAVSQALLAAAEGIAGPAPGVESFSNAGLHPELLARSLAERLDALGAPTLILVDLPGGSTLAAVQRASRGRADVHVVSGVNLPLLLDFLQNRDELSVADLVAHLLDRGRAGIRAVPPPVG